MSARRLRVVFSSQAQSELHDILLYTDQQWGRAQRRAYRKQLEAALAQLAKLPGLDNHRPGFGPGIRDHGVAQHAVIYQPTEAEVLILRILHVHKDFGANFDE